MSDNGMFGIDLTRRAGEPERLDDAPAPCREHPYGKRAQREVLPEREAGISPPVRQQGQQRTADREQIEAPSADTERGMDRER